MIEWRELPGLLKMSLRIVILFAGFIFLSGGDCGTVRITPVYGTFGFYNADQARNFTLNIADFLAELCTPQDQHCNDLVTGARNAAQGIDDAIAAYNPAIAGSAGSDRVASAMQAAAAAAREAFHWCLVLGVYPNRASIPNIPGYSETFWDVHVD